MRVFSIDITGCYCGEAMRNKFSRIAAGTEIKVHEYPWLVFIRVQRRKNSGQLGYEYCGGSVISDQ